MKKADFLDKNGSIRKRLGPAVLAEIYNQIWWAVFFVIGAYDDFFHGGFLVWVQAQKI